MGSTAAEKTEEELRREIEELDRQRQQITERLRDPRGLRPGGLSANGPRNYGAARQRGYIRPADRIDSEDQPASKRRLSSAVVKVKDGEATEDVLERAQDVKEKESTTESESKAIALHNVDKLSNLPHERSSFNRRGDVTRRLFRTDTGETGKEHLNRNRRMLGSLLGTLEKFQKEDKHLSATEAFMKRSNSLQRAEQKAREKSEKLRQQEREKIAENRRRDLTLRARVAAKAEEKKLELLFLKWSENHRIRGNYLRTKAEPCIYYMPKKPLDEDETVVQQKKEEAFLEWKIARREELSEYQKQIGEQYLANVERELERWQNTRRGNNNMMMNLQETMDKELETHQLEHGPKTRKIPGNDDDDDVEDINVGEDDIMDDDDVIVIVDDNNRSKSQGVNASPSPSH